MRNEVFMKKAIMESIQSQRPKQADSPAIAMAVLDTQGIVLSASASVADFIATTPKDFVGKSVFEFIHPDDHPLAITKLSDAFRYGDIDGVRVRMLHRDGTYHNVICSAQMHGEVAHLVVQDPLVIRDYLARTTADDVHMRILSAAANEAVWIFDIKAREFTYISEHFQDICGYTQDEMYKSQWDQILSPDFDALRAEIYDGRYFRKNIADDHVAVRNYDGRMIHKDGHFVPTETILSFRVNASGKDEVVGLTRIVAKQVQRAKNKHQYTTDILTGLPNRNAIATLIEESNKSKTTCQNVAIINLDQFRLVNESLGRDFADETLINVSRALTDSVGAMGKAFRYGGDEFMIISECMDKEDIIECLKGVLVAVNFPIQYQGKVLFLTATAGVAFGSDKQSLHTTIEQAIAALKIAKKKRTKFVVYSDNINDNQARSALLTQSLQTALANNEFELYYQPVFDLRTGKVSQAEALLRWNHPTLGRVAPLEFIPIAERTRLIIPMTDWVINEACRQLVEWQAKGIRNLIVSVNLSIVSFLYKGRQVVNQFSDAVKRHNILPSQIKIEVTESTLLNDVDDVVDVMSQLKTLGFQLALDDFGTGYSTFGYVKDLPLNITKLDRSLIVDLEHSNKSQKIVQSLITIVHGLGLEVVTEGVETTAQYEMLKSFGCDYVQGFLLSRPLPANAFYDYYVNVTKVGEQGLLKHERMERLIPVQEEQKPTVVFEQDHILKEKRRYQQLINEYNALHNLLAEVSTLFIRLDSNNINQRIQRALELAGNYVQADRVYIFNYDFDKQTTDNTFEWCAPGTSAQIQELQGVPLEAIPEWVNAHVAGETIYIPDVFDLLESNNIRQILEPQGVKSLMTLPMMSGKGCYGFIGFDSVTKHHTYSEFEQRILQELSNLILVAIERHEEHQRLLAEQELFAATLLSVEEGVVLTDTKGVITHFNNQFMEVLDRHAADVKGQPLASIITLREQTTQQVIHLPLERLLSGDLRQMNYSSVCLEVGQHLCHHTTVHFSTIYDHRAQVRGLTVTFRREDESQWAEAQLKRMQSIEMDMFCSYDKDARFLRVNQRMADVLGYRVDQLIGKNFYELIHSEDLNATHQAVEDIANMKSVTGFINRYRHHDGHFVYIEWHAQLGNDGIGYASARDVSDLITKESRLTYLLKTDYRTNLPNRRATEEKIREIGQSSESYPLYLIKIELTQLLNFSLLGQRVEADHLVGQFITAVNKCLPKETFIGRWSGNEFLVLLPNSTIQIAMEYRAKLLNYPCRDEGVIVGDWAHIGIGLATSLNEIAKAIELASV